MEFEPAELDNFNKWISGLFVGTAVIMGGWTLYALLAGNLERGPLITLALTVGILGLSALFTYFFKPAVYIVQPEGLLVKRCGPLKAVFIPFAEVEVVKALDAGSVWRSTRQFGGAGLFGYLGYFSVHGLGSCWLSATNWHKLVLLEGRKRWIISPADPESFVSYTTPFVESAKSLRKQLEGESEQS